MKRLMQLAFTSLLLALALPASSNGLIEGMFFDDEGDEIPASIAAFSVVEEGTQFEFHLHLTGGWIFNDIQIYCGTEPPPTKKKDKPKTKAFTVIVNDVNDHDVTAVCDMTESFDTAFIAIHADLVLFEDSNVIVNSAWAYFELLPVYYFDGGNYAAYFEYTP